MSFSKNIEQTPGLEGKLHEGMQALKKLDRDKIAPGAAKLAGSVDIDGALRSLHPTEARWDYLIGQLAGTKKTLALWMEVHSADGEHTIKEVQAKHAWLLKWKATSPLREHESRYYWIASGKCSFNQRAPQIKRLSMHGIRFCGSHLKLDSIP